MGVGWVCGFGSEREMREKGGGVVGRRCWFRQGWVDWVRMGMGLRQSVFSSGGERGVVQVQG